MNTMNTSRSDSRSTEEEMNETKTVHSPAPDGGIRAWLVVLGGFLTYFATFGTTLLVLLKRWTRR